MILFHLGIHCIEQSTEVREPANADKIRMTKMTTIEMMRMVMTLPRRNEGRVMQTHPCYLLVHSSSITGKVAEVRSGRGAGMDGQPSIESSMSYSRLRYHALISTIYREHLYRRHLLPRYQCNRCFEDLQSLAGLTEHQRLQTPCPLEDPEPQEGIDEDQERRLRAKRRNKGKLSEEDKWVEVYRLLFPGDELIPSPCMDSLRFHLLMLTTIQTKGFSAQNQPLANKMREHFFGDLKHSLKMSSQDECAPISRT